MAGVTYQNYVHVMFACKSECDLDGEYIIAVPHNFRKSVSKNTVATGTSLEGSIIGTAGIFIGPKISVSIAGFDLASISAKFGPEAKLTMPLLNSISYNDPNNALVAADSPYRGSVNECVSGEDALKETNFQLYLKAAVSGSLIKGLISTDFWIWKSSPLIELPKDFAKFKVTEPTV